MADAISIEELKQKLREELGLNGTQSVLAHVNLDAVGPVDGGADAIVDALLDVVDTLIMPAFTYQTQVVPQVGPPDNALEYGSGDTLNARAEIFRPDLPCHPDCGSVSEVLRQRPGTLRSVHPILSFVANGRRARTALASQTVENPLGPIAWLEARQGAVLLLGVDQRHNFSLHLAEQRAGRKTFVRWAVTLDDIEELPHIPGCMEGFNAVWRYQYAFTQVTQIGLARCELIEMRALLANAEKRLRQNANFMLCDKPSCLNCRTREVK